MNTKIFIIFIALILVFPQTVSVGASTEKQTLPVQSAGHTITPTDDKQTSNPIDSPFDLPNDNSVHHSQDGDDNKSHHFHYGRFSKKRSRILVSILFKIVLVITHLSSLIYAFHIFN